MMLIRAKKRTYGLELLEKLEDLDLPLKEGTLYSLLNRLTEDSFLQSSWETENLKGHPRKFYSLTKRGQRYLGEMEVEFDKMIDLVDQIQKAKKARKS